MKERPGVKKNQGQCFHEPSFCCAIVSWKLITIAALRKHNVSWAVTYEYLILLMCGSRNKNIYTPSTEDSLICTPHPPVFSVPGGLWWSPSPPGISRILNGDSLMYPGYQRFFSRAVGMFGVGQRLTHLQPGYRLPSFGNSKWFWYLKTKKVNANSVTKIW